MTTDSLPDSWPEIVRQWQSATAYIAEKTSSLPVSQVVASLGSWLDLLIDPALSPTIRDDQIREFQQLFVRRWEVGAMHMMAGDTERIGQQILLDPSMDITQGRKPYGKDLAHAFWSAIVALQNDAPTVEAPDVLPHRDLLREHVRMMATRRGRLYMPVISYAPLAEVEWQAVLSEMSKIVDVTLAVEGVALFWLQGTFVRDVSGRIMLQPELIFRRAGPGTRIKPLRLIMGCEYHRHGEWLGELYDAVEGRQPKLHDDLLAKIPLHPVTMQLFPGDKDYESYKPENLSTVEREVSDRIFRIEREPPQRAPILVEEDFEKPVPPEPPLPPSAEASESEPAAPAPGIVLRAPTTADLKQDADWLRRKAQLALVENKALAKKYLLASTLLDNSSVDVWMTLSQLASSEREKKTFLRQAEKILNQQ